MDSLDLKIVERLDKNARESYARIGSRLGLGPRAVQRRVAGMVDSGFVRGFEVVLEPSTLGIGEVICDLLIGPGFKNEDVRRSLLSIRQISEILTLAAGNLVTYVYYRDSSQLEDALSQISQVRGVADVQYEVAPTRSEMFQDKLTRSGWKIVNSLNHYARKDIVEIAREAELSTKTIQRQLRWFIRQGLLRFGVDVDVSKATDLFVYMLLVRFRAGFSKTSITSQIRSVVHTIWRELRTVNPFVSILWLHAKSTSDLERDVESVRLVLGVSNVRIMIVTDDRKNTGFLDPILAERAE